MSTATSAEACGRRDGILAVAADILQELGYSGLTMRAVGLRARISPGLIYHYFADKDDVVAALMAMRLDELRGDITASASQAQVVDALRMLVAPTTELWRIFGRSLGSGWTRTGGTTKATSAERLSAAASWRATRRDLLSCLRQVAANEGIALRPGGTLVPFVWNSLTGLADDLVYGWSRAAGISDARLIEDTIEAVATAITAHGLLSRGGNSVSARRTRKGRSQ